MVASLFLALFVLTSQIQPAQSADVPDRIESVEIRGNRRVPSDTIRYHIRTKSGDVQNMEMIRRDVKELYAQNYFDDIRVDADDGKNGGIVVIFVVKEKPLIRSIDFTGSNAITKADILEKLKQKKISMSQESPFDPSKIKQVETLIRAMLAEKGHQDAKVETTTEAVLPNAVKLTFKITDGPAI